MEDLSRAERSRSAAHRPVLQSLRERVPVDARMRAFFERQRRPALVSTLAGSKYSAAFADDPSVEPLADHRDRGTGFRSAQILGHRNRERNADHRVTKSCQKVRTTFWQLYLTQ